MDDAQLLQRAARGDTDALSALYDRHAASMLAVAVRMLGDPREAEDLLHDVFLEAWKRAADHDPSRGSVRTWLLMRVRSRALDRHGRSARGRIVAKKVEQMARPQSADPFREERLAVRQGLAQLPQDVRSVLEDSYFMGMTAPEIADRSEIPLGTVKSRLARGLRLLEGLLRESEHKGS